MINWMYAWEVGRRKKWRLPGSGLQHIVSGVRNEAKELPRNHQAENQPRRGWAGPHTGELASRLCWLGSPGGDATIGFQALESELKNGIEVGDWFGRMKSHFKIKPQAKFATYTSTLFFLLLFLLQPHPPPPPSTRFPTSPPKFTLLFSSLPFFHHQRFSSFQSLRVWSAVFQNVN